MAAKLKLLLRNQTLRLAFKGLILSFLIFLTKHNGGFYEILALASVLTYFYFKPFLNQGKFMAEILLSLLAVTLLPKDIDISTLAFCSIFFASIISIFIGLKNIVFIEKENPEYIARLFLLLAFLGLFFSGVWSYTIGILVIFFISLFILNGFFLIFANYSRSRILALISAILLVEIVWSISITPTDSISRLSIASLLTFGLSYSVFAFLKGNLRFPFLKTN